MTNGTSSGVINLDVVLDPVDISVDNVLVLVGVAG